MTFKNTLLYICFIFKCFHVKILTLTSLESRETHKSSKTARLLSKLKQPLHIMDSAGDISKQNPLEMGHNIPSICSAARVFVISLKNKAAVPVGYHTPCRLAEGELNVSSILPQYLRATTNIIFSWRRCRKMSCTYT